MNTKHTPGPWAARKDPEGLAIVGGSGEYPGLPEYVGMIKNIYGRDEANARLIAAAPELLEALKEIHADTSLWWTPGMREKVRKVIAKAEGR